MFLVGFELGMSEILCRFGLGLCGLLENEYISMVLKDFEMDESCECKDWIYVFICVDIVCCV